MPAAGALGGGDAAAGGLVPLRHFLGGPVGMPGGLGDPAGWARAAWLQRVTRSIARRLLGARSKSQ